jgi:dihydroorotase (multifunctional complex type)
VANSFLIRNGTLVSSAGLQKADILINGEQIVEVGTTIQHPTTNIVNAEGLLIFPGLIDPHTHLREPGGEHKEDFYTGTSAALAGGITTVFGMPNTNPAMIDRASLDNGLELAAQKAVCDFGLFLGATNTNFKLKQTNPDLRECGLKIYMGSSTGDLLVESFESQYAHFVSYPHDRVIAVHAEHEPAVRYFAQHGQRRPPICAELETARAITLAGQCHRRLHVCHVSTRREVELIADAKARGVPVTCEFSPHHLFLVARDETRVSNVEATFDMPRSSFFEMNPPLRAQADVDYMWNHLAVADCIATDHAPHTLEEKRNARPPMGTPGLETLLPLLLTAVHDGKLRYEDIARLCCEGPARIFNIPRKGKIFAGFDADLTLVDPTSQWLIGDNPLFTKCNWTPFQGWPVHGAITQVFLRGQPAYRDGKIVAKSGYGRRISN